MITIYNSKKNKLVKSESIFCLDHYKFFNGGLKLIKQVNQSKFIFKCLVCESNFQVIIKEPYCLCDKCNGTFNYYWCQKCGGTGVVDWMEKILGKNSHFPDPTVNWKNLEKDIAKAKTFEAVYTFDYAIGVKNENQK